MAETKEKKDEKDGQEEKWAKYARRQLVKSYFYLGFLFFVPMLVLYWLGAPLIGCIATGFIVAVFFWVYTLETLPSYGGINISRGPGEKSNNAGRLQLWDEKKVLVGIARRASGARYSCLAVSG